MDPNANNPVLDEIDRAHQSLSPPARAALETAGSSLGAAPPSAPTSEAGGGTPPLAPPPIDTPPALGATPAAAQTNLPAAPAMATPGFTPAALSPSTQAHMKTRDDMIAAGSGTDQIHNPWARGAARVAGAVGGAFFPALTMAIPGTDLHHQMLVHQQQGIVNNDLAGEQEQAKITGEQQRQRQAEASFPQEQTIRGLTGEHLSSQIAGENQRQEQNRIAFPTEEALRQANVRHTEAQTGAITNPTPKGEDAPLSDSQIQGVNGGALERWKVLNGDKPIPDSLLLKPGATYRDFGMMDKLLEGTEKARGTHEQQQALNDLRQQQLALAGQRLTVTLNNGDRRDIRDARKTATADLTKQFGVAQLQAQNAQLALNELKNGGAVGQAVGIIKSIVAAAGGQGSGVRVNIPEITSIAKARGWVGDFEGFINSGLGKGKLTSTQVNQLSQILGDIQQRAGQKLEQIHGAIGQIQDAETLEDINRATSGYRQQQISAVSPNSGAGGGAGVPKEGETFNGHKVLKVERVQ